MKVIGALQQIACMVTLLLSLESNALNSLIYRFTMRSFLPAACHRTYKELNATWTYRHLGTGIPGDYPNDQTSSISYIGSFTGTVTGSKTGRNMCPVWDDIALGNLNGHPDFEVSDSNLYAEGCSGTSFPLTSTANGGASCATTSLTPIVEQTLETHEDGLPKPIYCQTRIFPNDPRCGWIVSSKKATTSGPTHFATWYRDSSEYNMRTGVLLRLTETSPNSGLFKFTSGSFFPLAQSFSQSVKPGPKPCTNVSPTNRTLNCANGGRVFPLAKKINADDSSTRVFSFTSEHHSFFEFKGNETFTFSGDDDVWVFINERLAVDVGGLHSGLTATIDLSKPFVQSQLGLEPGQVYSLDMYHAERHSSASQFEISTGLTGGCNVLQSGKTSYTWDPPKLSTDWKLVGGPTWAVVQDSTIKLTDSAVQGSVGYAFLQQQVNVGTGFTLSFNFSATSKGEGFVFVIQRDDIVDINGGSGGNLGFKNTLDSVGIVFDFCVDRDANVENPSCNERELRMHYLANGGSNNAGPSTRVLRAPLRLPVVPNDGQVHTVEINYFAKSPPWLEVVMDDDLLLQKRGINLDTVIGGRNAFMGFSASTGVTASTITISDFSVKAVAIEDRFTTATGIPGPSDPALNATADGREFVSVDLKNFDFCSQTIEFGGFDNRAKGLLTLVELASNEESQAGRRQLQGNDSTNAPITGYVGMPVEAEVVDNLNGNYSLRFSTTVPGVYSMQVWYGVGCFSNGTNAGTIVTNVSTPTCFTASSNRSVVFAPVPPTPTPPPLDEASGLPQEAIVGIGVAAGVVGTVGSILLVFGMRMRRQWRRDKAFIDAGRAAVAERGVEYLGDTDLDALQNRLQQTLHAIQAERAKKLREGDKQEMIDELNRQRGELQEQVRRLKIKANGGDPNSVEPQGLGLNRIRKSFAASRVSRGISMRMSRGLSMALGAPVPEQEPIGSEMASGNPLFQRFSQAFKKKQTVPEHIDV